MVKQKTLGRRLVGSESFSLVAALFAVILVFSLINPNYFTAQNFRNIFTAASLTGLIALGEAMLLIGGQMDLSPGSTAAFSGVAAAMLLSSGVPTLLTILIVISVGIGIGSFNAFFTTQLRISPFIVTFAAQSIIRGFCYIISNGESILIKDQAFLKIGTMDVLGISFPIFFMVIMFVVFYIIMTKTSFGRSVYVVGGNNVAARLAGISTKFTTYMLFIIMSVLAAVGGTILAARMNTGQPQACTGLEFDGITAAILGGVAMSGGYGSIINTFIGLMILQGFNNGLILLNVQSFWQLVAKGALLLLALSFDYFRSKNRQ